MTVHRFEISILSACAAFMPLTPGPELDRPVTLIQPPNPVTAIKDEEKIPLAAPAPVTAPAAKAKAPHTAPASHTAVYIIDSGVFIYPTDESPVVVQAGSGIGKDHNNPASQCESSAGPIPVGIYGIGPVFTASIHLKNGQNVHKQASALTPERFARSCDPVRFGFLLHPNMNGINQDKAASNYQSHGCIVSDPKVIEAIQQAQHEGWINKVAVYASAKEAQMSPEMRGRYEEFLQEHTPAVPTARAKIVGSQGSRPTGPAS